MRTNQKMKCKNKTVNRRIPSAHISQFLQKKERNFLNLGGKPLLSNYWEER